MIVVTGGTGDVGKEVVAELASKGHDAIAFDIALNPKRLPNSERVKGVKGNIMNLSEVISTIKSHSADTVVHLASLLTTDCEARPYEAVGVNMYGTATVLEACRLADVKRVVFASTSSVYGSSAAELIDETVTKEPMNVYGSLKYGAELYAQVFAKKYGLTYAACRLRIIFGPGQRSDTGAMKILNVKRLLGELREKGQSLFVGEPSQKLEVTHPKDAAHALVLAALADSLKHNAYNIMTGSYSFQEIAKSFERTMPGTTITFDPTRSRKAAFGGPGAGFGVYDISRARKELGYEPAYDIEKIVKEVVDSELGAMAAR